MKGCELYMANYEISLGIELDTSNLQKQINDAGSNKTIPLKIEIENLSEIKKQIDSLGGTKKKDLLTFDTTKLENSLKDVKDVITDIRNSLGTLDNGGSMKSLVASINQIGTALDKVSGKFDSFTADLKALGSKDFSINFDLKLGGGSSPSNSAAYGDYVRQELYPELKRQEQAITKYLAQYYKTNEISAVDKLYKASGRNGGFQSIWSMLDQLEAPLKKSDVLSDRISQFRNFFKEINSMAKMQGIDLSPVMSQFDKLPDELIENANDIKNGTAQVKNNMEELKNVFNSGIDAEGLSNQLDSIVVDLGEIKTALQGLSSGISLEGLTASFDKLSNSIEKLVNNCNNVKRVVNDSLGGKIDINVDDSSIENATKKLNEMGVVGQKISTKFKGDKLVEWDVKGIQKMENGLERIVTIKNSLNKDDKWISSTTYSQPIINDFEKLKTLAERMSNLRIDILKSDDAADISKMTVELQKLNNEYDELFANTKGNLTNKQLSQLDNINSKALDEFNKELNEFIKLQNQIENKKFDIGKLELLGGKENEIEELNRQLKELEDTYNHLMGTFMKKVSANSDIIKIDDFSGLEDGIANAVKNAENRLAEFKAKLEDTKRELAEGFKVDIEVGKYDNEISNLEEKFRKLSSSSKDFEKLEAAIEDVKRAYKEMESAAGTGDEVADTERLIKSQEEYAEAIKKATNLLRIQDRELKRQADIDLLSDKKTALKLDMTNWLEKNSRAVKDYGEEIKRLMSLLDNLGELDFTGFNDINRSFNLTKKAAERFGKTGLTAFDKLKSKFKEYATYLSAAEMFMYAEQALRSMFEQVKLIDAAMTELKKVTNESDASYAQFLDNASTRAKELGTTIDGLISSTADFARLGYDFKDAQGLAEIANIYAVVGDDVEGVEGATESLISTLAAFKDEMNGLSNTDFAMSIIDVFNELGNNFAISSGGLGEALERSASSLAAANNTLAESAALITAANTVVVLCHAA